MQLTTTSDLKSYGDNLLKSVKTFDGFGREVEARRYESATSYVTTKKAYDALGRVATTYNPYRSASDETYGRSTISYDAFSRVKQLDTFDKDDASTGTVLTTYDGLKVTVTDQSGRKRRTETDALGRIVLVTEPNGAGSLDASDSPKTVYKYDVLGNMTEVRVGAILQSTGEYAGGQTRTFVYDSHSRLILERVPEQEATLTDARAAGVWSARYTYGADGRLKQKADARGKTITYLYDALGRLKSVDYTDTTPDVTYTYDTAPGGKGLPASVKNSASTYRYEAYDELGRVKASAQTVHRPGGDVTYTMPDYSYDRAGNLVSQTYPSGRVVTTDYDAAGRVAGVRNQSGFYYAGGAPSGEPGADDRITYAAHGAVSAMRLGNGLWEHSVFNSRLQPAEIGLGTTRTASNVLRLEYGYGEVVGGVLDPTKNNGNIRSQSISVPAVVVSTAETIPARTFTQTYAYDPVNRLRGADEVAGAAPTWTQGYLYDTFGNRRLDESQTRRAGAGGVMEAVVSDSNRAILNPVIDPATNRVSAAGYAYDEAGNLLCDPAHQCSTQPAFAAFYVYDAENRLVSAGALAEYFYDGDGKRVRKVSGTQETVFVYDVAGRLVAEYSDAGTGGGTSYLTQDHLGSTRVVTGQGGANDVKGRFDYQPFGPEVDGRAGYGAGPVRQKFTGYERDDETGLDFAQARYYAKALGRFTSVDPNNYQASRTPYDPQSWNAYSYAKNNPLNASDPSGKGIDDDWQLFITPVTALATAVRMTFEERVKSDREYLLDWERHMKGDLVVQSPHGGSPVRLHPSTMNSVNVILWADHMRWLMDNGGRVQSLPEGTVIVDSADIALGYRQRKERVEPPPSDIQNPQAHHEMPQKFRDTFKKAGIDIDAPEHIRWVEASKHLSWSKKFNQVWDDFLRQNPNATKEQILEQMRRMQNDPRFPSQ